jgi:nucleoside-diphosphate-sugar epimerase
MKHLKFHSQVCEHSPHSRSKEEDAIRPSDPELKQEMIEADSYGDQKLQGEEMLTSQVMAPYIIFRLPDVMGERDSTKRWWFYVMWLQHYKTIREPIPIPAHLENLKTSYVYAADVGTIIADIIFGRFTPEINNQIFNLGFDTGFTLKELLTEMSNILGVEIEFEVKEKAVYMLPSVTRGQVDISKAKKYFNFKPTDWKMALRKTIYFYKKAHKKFPKERDQILDKLIKLLVPEEKKEIVLKTLQSGMVYKIY